MLSGLFESYPSFEPSEKLIQALNILSNFQFLGGNEAPILDEEAEEEKKEHLANYMMPFVQTITGELAKKFPEYVKKRENSRSLLPGSSTVLKEFLSENAQDLKKELMRNIDNVESEGFASCFWHDLYVRYVRPLKESMMILQYEYERYFNSDFPDDVDINNYSMHELYDKHFPQLVFGAR